MSEPLDIIVIDNKIKNNLEQEYNNLHVYKQKLQDLQDTLSKTDNINNRIRKNIIENKDKLINYINNLELKTEYNFYIMLTLPLIEEYKKMLLKPLKLSFLGKPSKNNSTKNKLISSYIDIASNYIEINNFNKNTSDNITCINCSNKKDFDIIDKNIYICQQCYAEQLVLRHISSYNDIDRVNISSKYMYDRKIHFRDCIKQYQGKQNSTIPDKIYKSLAEQFKNHHLLVGNFDTPKEERFKNITKNHILLFLKELGYSNHYENAHLIHYKFTRIKPDDISYLEDQLLDDFDSLTELYDKKFKHINRKNFINTQYVLYQLLRRHKHECNKEEFIILKTIDRKFFHDEVCKSLFEELGWNHTPFY